MPRDSPVAGLRIRGGALEDLTCLETIERETAAMFARTVVPPQAARPLPRRWLAEQMAASLLWVASVHDTDPVGFIVCERHGASLHIAEMDVRPLYGRRGIGARLLLHACTVAKTLHCRSVTLTTFLHLPWNAPFYARHGFTVVPFPGRTAHLTRALRRERRQGLRNRVAMSKAPHAQSSMRRVRTRIRSRHMEHASACALEPGC